MPNKIMNMGELGLLLWQKEKTMPHLRSVIAWKSRSNKLNPTFFSAYQGEADFCQTYKMLVCNC